MKTKIVLLQHENLKEEELINVLSEKWSIKPKKAELIIEKVKGGQMVELTVGPEESSKKLLTDFFKHGIKGRLSVELDLGY